MRFENVSCRCAANRGGYSLGANQSNGLRRTNADKRHAVELALKEFPKLSDRAIAEMCGVSQPFVSEFRPKVITVITSETHTGKDGKEYPARRPAAKPDALTAFAQSAIERGAIEAPEEEKPRVTAS